MNAIETLYDGHRFRSRLEARWAVFFNAMGVKYEYEPLGYVLTDGECYLPDFWLPDQQFYVEVKGELPTPKERDKADALAVSTGEPVFILYGDVPMPPSYPNDGAELHLSSGDEQHAVTDTGWRWAECPDCGRVDMVFDARLERMTHAEGCPNDSECYGDQTPRMMRAYRMARSARFEHGEKPGERFATELARRGRNPSYSELKEALGPKTWERP